jgi:hypothetical protein
MDDRGDGADPFEKEREAGERAGRKRLGEDGCPQARPSAEQQDATDRTKMTVKHSLKRGPQETGRSRGET